MRRPWFSLSDNALYLFDLLHKMQLSSKSPSSICQDDIYATRFSGIDRIEYHRCRIGLLLAASILSDNGNIIALTPSHQLFACSGTESVTGS